MVVGFRHRPDPDLAAQDLPRCPVRVVPANVERRAATPGPHGHGRTVRRMVIQTARRRLYPVALRVFRRLPPPVRRTLVRLGTPGYTVGAVAVIEHEGEVLFLRQPHRVGWSLPGGLLDSGETARVGLEREVAEETGLKVKVSMPLTVQVNSRLRRVDVIFHVPIDRRPEVTPGGEAEGHRWIAPNQVPEMDASTREILDVFAAVGRPGGQAGCLLA